MDGMRYNSDFMTVEDEKILLTKIDAEPWLNDLKRRVQYYGYKYDYHKRKIDTSAEVTPLPNWAKMWAKRLIRYDFLKKMPDQLIVNEYLPGQGIGQHVDSVSCFDNFIASISLGSGCMMKFVSIIDKSEQDIWLDQRSALMLRNGSRYSWTHGIEPLEADDRRGNGIMVPRTRRVSLTFRNVLLS